MRPITALMAAAALSVSAFGLAFAQTIDDAREAFSTGQLQKAAEMFSKLAEEGDPDAQFAVGGFYSIGFAGVPLDRAKALAWYRKAAEQGHVRAQYELAGAYDNGRGVPKNDAEAVIWYRKAADQGNADALHELATRYLNGEGVLESDFDAYVFSSLALKQGVSDEQERLPTISKRMTTEQLAKADRKAEEIWEQFPRFRYDPHEEAKKGNVYAQLNLGERYASGRDVPKDDEEAAKWFRKAAEQGNVDGQFTIANIYLEGKGVPQSDEEAESWFHKAAVQYREASEQGDPYAQFRLGSLYADGNGVPQSDKEAISLFRKAAGRGFSDAQYELGSRYASGEGVIANDVDAYMWTFIATREGKTDTLNNLSMLTERMTPDQVSEAQRNAMDFWSGDHDK